MVDVYKVIVVVNRSESAGDEMITDRSASSSCDVSVIIPTHNRWFMVDRAVASVARQIGVRVQVIVIDDGSSSEVGHVCRHANANVSVQVVRHSTPHGVSMARNTGLEIATSEYIAWLDDDDVFAPTKLHRQLEVLRAHGRERSWSVTGVVIVDQRGRVIGLRDTLQVSSAAIRATGHNIVPGGGSGVVGHRSLYDDVGGFSDRHGVLADWDMWVRLANIAECFPVPDPLLAYQSDGAGMSHSSTRLITDLGFLVEDHPTLAISDPDGFDVYHRWVRFTHRRAGRWREAAAIDVQLLRKTKNPRYLVEMARSITFPAEWEVRSTLNALRYKRRTPDWLSEAWLPDGELQPVAAPLPANSLDTVGGAK